MISLYTIIKAKDKLIIPLAADYNNIDETKRQSRWGFKSRRCHICCRNLIYLGPTLQMVSKAFATNIIKDLIDVNLAGVTNKSLPPTLLRCHCH